MTLLFAAVISWAVLCVPSLAQAAAVEAEQFALQSDLDHVWTMTAAGLVFMMQAGFLFLEAGLVRSKNSINVAHKNLTDFVFSSFLFGLIGFSVMFGTSQWGLFGYSSELAFFNFEEDWTLTFFVFQMMFCGTAATIVSGSVAERTRMSGYLIMTMIIALFIYPVTGHWAWGGLLNGQEEPWLQSLGFMDFAGSTIVHSVGAWVALAAIIIVGPRLGRFDENGKPNKMHGHSPILATFGALILWVGWIGFNGGSTTAGTGDFALIVTNTMLAGATGALMQTFLGFTRSKMHRPEWLINGSLSGLVAITAGCAYVSPQSAVIIGALGSAVCYFGSRALVSMRLDDPLGAISVHGFAGAAGTILTGVFAPLDQIYADTRLEQIGIQLLGVGTVFLYAFTVAFVLLRLASSFLRAPDDDGSGLRVPEEDEREGLNISEHDAPLGTTGLVKAMSEMLEDPEGGVEPVFIEPGEDGYEAAVLFNQIAERAQNQAAREKELYETTSNQILTDLSGIMQRVQEGDLSARMSSVDEGPFVNVPQDVNNMINEIDAMVQQLGQSSQILSNTAQDLLSRSEELAQIQVQQSDKLDGLANHILRLRDASDAAAKDIEVCLQQATNARGQVTHSAEVSKDARDRINQTWGAVSRIVDAVAMIDDVAFETRLLSLNASVEAARASGEDTSGFGVVASEVRVLADASSRSASEIRDIVENVREGTQTAVERVEQTDDALRQVRDGIENNAKLMVKLDELEKDNRSALQTIEGALMQLNTSAQESRSMAEETKSVARDLRQHAADSDARLAKYRAAPDLRDAA